MIPDIDLETGISSVTGIAALWIFYKKFLVKNKSEDVNLKGELAHMDVIRLLHSELLRMSEINQKLIEAVQCLQDENMNLKFEVHKLNGTLLDLKSKLETMRTRKTDPDFIENNAERRTS